MRSDAYIRVSCDKCEDPDMDEEVELTALACGGYDERNVDASLKRNGWKKDGERDICPNCAEDGEE